MQIQGLVLDQSKVNDTKGPLWYLQDEKSTDASSNADLGIENIVIVPASSEAQAKSGVIGQVQLHTVVGSFYFSAFRGKQDANSVRLVFPSREYMENGEKKYRDEYRLNQSVRAQVLKHVHSKCKQASVEQQAQAQAQAQTQANPALAALAGLDANTIALLVAALGGAGGAGAVQPQAQAQAQAQTAGATETPTVPPIISDSAF